MDALSYPALAIATVLVLVLGWLALVVNGKMQYSNAQGIKLLALLGAVAVATSQWFAGDRQSAFGTLCAAFASASAVGLKS